MARILIVDDEHLTIEMLSTFLSASGHEPIGALSARQTWDKLAYLEPDAILLDIMLPDMNGLEICRDLRNNESTRNLPIIMISAADPPLIREAETVGATGYLQKPIKLNVLMQTLAKHGVH
jgi:CheY-like chemotaxis protein